MSSRAPQQTHTTVTTEELAPSGQTSIRQVILAGLLAGLSTEVIAQQVQALSPESAAAKKSGRHISWYRSQLVKQGLLPKQVKQDRRHPGWALLKA